MGDIHAGELRLSLLAKTSQTQKFGAEEISTVLAIHEQTLKTEINSSSQNFENMLTDIIGTESTDDEKCIFLFFGI